MPSDLDHALLSPVKLPEFGNIEVGWAMCLNPMCEQFGAFFGPEDVPGSAVSRYRVVSGKTVKRKSVRLQCRGCGQAGTVYAGSSLRAVARHFLSLSLPFADCTNEECPNHGVNVFEHLGQRRSLEPTRYHVHGAHSLICVECKQAGREFAHFEIGVAPGLQRKNKKEAAKVRLSVSRIIASAREHLPVTTVRGLFGIPVGTYYRRLFRIGARVRDYLAYRNAFLLSPEFSRKHREPVRVYTDVLNISLHQVGDVARSKLVKVIVSVVGLEKTHFVLAAHPCFLPESKAPKTEELQTDGNKEHYLSRRWDCLETVFGDEPLFHDGEFGTDVPSEGHKGYFLKSPYPEVAHFLTVEKMLSGFGRRHYFMDGARDLAQSALVAMRQQVLDKRVEIALFQYEKHGESRATGKGRKKAEAEKQGDEAGTPKQPGYVGRRRADEPTLRTASRFVENRFRAKLSTGVLPLDKRTDASFRAQVWKTAFRGAYSKAGGWAWLRFPVNLKQHPSCRTLWLSRRPADAVDEGILFLLHATLQPVDSAFASIRRRTNSARRPWKGAIGLSFLDHSYSPQVVGAEVTMYLFHRNYHRRPFGPREQLIPAERMGLSPQKGKALLSPEKAMWGFRLEVRHAREITRWLTRRTGN